MMSQVIASYAAWIEIAIATAALCVLFGAAARYMATVIALDAVVLEKKASRPSQISLYGPGMAWR